jgi:hypothetical protein
VKEQKVGFPPLNIVATSFLSRQNMARVKISLSSFLPAIFGHPPISNHFSTFGFLFLSTMTETDGVFFVQSRKASKKRIYIGNLPQESDLKPRLVEFLNQSAGLNVDEYDVSISEKQCSALVAVQDVNQVMATLRDVSFDGRTLVVQRETKNRQTNNTNAKQPFGGGWSRPSTTKEKRLHVQNKDPVNKAPPIVRNEMENEGPADEWDVSEHVGSTIASEIKATEEDPSVDVLNTMIASTAAVTLLSSMNGFGLDTDRKSNVVTDSSQEEPPQTDPTADVTDNVTREDLGSLSKKPLSELLADYGEQDLDFKSFVPTEEPSDVPKTKTRQDYQNRLTLQSKAPIHVELTSFGYMHGAPSELRSGWSHAHPLSPVDCRELPQVPHYMARQDGLSPAVKRALLNARKEDDTRDNSVRECAKSMGKQIFTALEEAISSGHGHASPLRMTVHAGSESGRHRSVLVCELGATALRKLLRSNENNRITQPVSVGTRHRDIERRQREMERTGVSKQKELESEW